MNILSDYRLTIDSRSVASDETIEVVNPATGKTLASAPDYSKEQLDLAVAAARRAFKSGLQAVSQMSPPVHISENSNAQSIRTHYVPLGVICAIAPWNFPVMLAMWKVTPALVAGNTMVLRPSPCTPLCTLKIGEIFQALFPPGVLNVISDGDRLGPWMTAHHGFDKISFTGSTATGKRVLESASKDLKRLTVELGGNGAAIVMPDVNIEEVAEKSFFGAFFNSSQICVSTNLHPDTAFDGRKNRGCGIENGMEGLLEYMAPQSICIANPSAPALSRTAVTDGTVVRT